MKYVFKNTWTPCKLFKNSWEAETSVPLSAGWWGNPARSAISTSCPFLRRNLCRLVLYPRALCVSASLELGPLHVSCRPESWPHGGNPFWNMFPDSLISSGAFQVTHSVWLTLSAGERVQCQHLCKTHIPCINGSDQVGAITQNPRVLLSPRNPASHKLRSPRGEACPSLHTWEDFCSWF